MTSPDDAVTVRRLKEYLDEFEEDAPVAVAASGAYDFLDEKGLEDAETIANYGDKTVPYLNGDRQ